MEAGSSLEPVEWFMERYSGFAVSRREDSSSTGRSALAERRIGVYVGPRDQKTSHLRLFAQRCASLLAQRALFIQNIGLRSQPWRTTHSPSQQSPARCRQRRAAHK